MFQAMGQRALNGLWREQGRPPEGRYTPDALKQAVAIVAATAAAHRQQVCRARRVAA